jgi:hypothetical protein
MRNLITVTILAAGALIATAAPAAAQNSAPAGTRAADEASSQRQAQDSSQPQADNRRVCISERLSGSRMPRRVCRTAREWAQLQGGDDDDR